MKDALLARMREPSTWIGLGGFIGSMAFLPHAADIGQTIAVLGVAVASVLGIWLPEGRS